MAGFRDLRPCEEAVRVKVSIDASYLFARILGLQGKTLVFKTASGTTTGARPLDTDSVTVLPAGTTVPGPLWFFARGHQSLAASKWPTYGKRDNPAIPKGMLRTNACLGPPCRNLTDMAARLIANKNSASR